MHRCVCSRKSYVVAAAAADAAAHRDLWVRFAVAAPQLGHSRFRSQRTHADWGFGHRAVTARRDSWADADAVWEPVASGSASRLAAAAAATEATITKSQQ